jgi:hypothetical protein
MFTSLILKNNHVINLSRETLVLRTFSTTTTSGGGGKHTEQAKGPWERLKDYLLFRPGATSWASSPKHAVAGQGYRFPSPASRPQPNIPTVESEETLYNTQYYTRDTRRNQNLGKVLAQEPLKEFPLEKPAEVSF